MTMEASATQSEKIVLVRIKNVVGCLYLPPMLTTKAVLHAKGGPSFGDTGDSSLWPVAKKYNRILFVPDYIGYCRSYGSFNFYSCLETLHEAEDFLCGKLQGTEIATGGAISLGCNDIVLEGSSWGGAIVPFLELHHHSSIEDIVIVKGVTDWSSLNNGDYVEENTVQTSRLIEQGWENVYRGYANSEWPEIFRGKLSEFNPIDNLRLLQGKRVYVAHGRADTSVNWRRSKLFYKKLRQEFPNIEAHWKLLSGDHSSATNARGLEFALATLGQAKR